jgi:hypothetical protein
MRLTSLPQSWRIALTVFAINALYATTYLGNPMSKSILDLTVSLVNRGALDIDPYAGNSTDVAYYPETDHYYSGMPPGLSLVCVPYYIALKPVLWLVSTPERERAIDNLALRATPRVGWRPSEKRLAIILLDLFICIFGFAALAGAMAAMFHKALVVLYPDLTGRQRLVTTWLFAFGTLWFIYSPGIYHRIFSTALCFGAFLLALMDENERPSLRWRGLLFGLALGLAIATSYEIAIVAVILMLFVQAQWNAKWSGGWTLAGMGLFLALLAAYHTACFGGPLHTPYSFRIAGSIVPPGFHKVVENTGPSIWDVRRIYEFLFGSRYGFFFYSPLLLLSIPGLASIRHSPRMGRVVLTAFGIFFWLMLFHFMMGYHGLPGEFGFRMMMPAIPFLMLLVPLTYRWSWPWPVAAVAALSAVILGKGVMYGIHAGRPFWSNYPELVRRYGFSNYTLANLKDHVWPGMSPLAISAIHVAALALIGLSLWHFVWRTDSRS